MLILLDLKSVSLKKDLQWGRLIHAQVEELQNGSNMFVMTALVDMYGKCGSMVDARCVFDNLQKLDVVSWTALVLGYVDNLQGHTALDMFWKMKEHGCVPNSFTYVAALKACTSLAENENEKKNSIYLQLGREIHMGTGNQLNHYVQTMLIDMYSRYGSMAEARSVFDSMQRPDVVSWTALILGYAENGEEYHALALFSKMKSSDCQPNAVTYVAALKACTSLGNRDGLERGREVHFDIGSQLNHHINTTLIDMYCKCGSMVEAHRVFDSIPEPDVVHWNALILGYADNGEGNVALNLYSMMKARGFAPNSITYISVLKACTSLPAKGYDDKCLEQGRYIHGNIRGCCLDDHYVQTALVKMYAKCGSMVDAQDVFKSIQNPNVVHWNALLLGYVENGEEHTALDLFSSMKAGGRLPDAVTYLAVLKACGNVGALSLGRKFHSEIREFTPYVVSCVVDLYAKCGSMVEAREVIYSHPETRNATAWTALLMGYAQFGDSRSVFDLLDAMLDDGLRPDAITSLCVLLCCSHAGLVEEANAYFETMQVNYGITPSIKHYNCIVYVLGRANLLNEAVGVIQKMPCLANEVTWMTLLSVCNNWKNVEIGRGAFQVLVDMQERNASAYVLMAHIYGSRGMREEQERVLLKGKNAIDENKGHWFA